MSKLIVGIDFGTSTTVVRACLEGTDNPYPIKHRESSVIPTLIFKDENGNLYYGKDAENCNENGTQGSLIHGFKMGLTLSDETKKETCRGYIKKYLSFIYDLYSEQYTTLPPHDEVVVFVSYPAKWTSDMAEFMINTVKEVGFGSCVYGMSEPEAASCYSMKRRSGELIKAGIMVPERKLNVMMLDLGAGTSDISIFKAYANAQNDLFLEDVLSFPSIKEGNFCGGREIDNIISKYVREQLDIKESVFSPSLAKQWKESFVSACLGRGDVVNTIPPNVLNIFDAIGRDAGGFVFSRNKFESITSDHWANLYQIIHSAIKQYKKVYQVGAEDIDLILLTGGHSKWYCVKNLILGEGVDGCIGKSYNDQDGNIVEALNFTKIKTDQNRLIIEPNPHETVALGMCLKDSSVMFNTLMNNVWVDIIIGGNKSVPILIAKIGQNLPLKKKFTHKVSLNKSALEKQEFDVVVNLYFGPSIESSKIISFRERVDNDSGRWFANIILLGLPVFLGGFDTTIETPIEIIVNEDNTIGIEGSILYADGENKATKDLQYLKDSDGNIVKIKKSGIR